MFDQNTYCPYTGLRSFTEEEAIYFKGRDTHIEEATKQLEERKFLMLTGSSGDGKSSLVYAGIVPHARAGFLKSQFSNWLVADFKPERTPFKNLCDVLAKRLGITNTETVEAELSHGYSSLVELYKNSNFYHDITDGEGNTIGDEEKKKLQRGSANLLILADQFEEFFTNPENYTKGVTSQESNLVINLLLETATIAREENLPIYVVCTMRSDYIGQCAAFRGLPEFIGYSQFFVPRLNRKQLEEVIVEPAILSGNRISKRLVERLIYDITEGVDQLPILQHALNQIWRASNDGKEEMDLIHYAMVGGMSGSELPEEDSLHFDQWFSSLPNKIKECFEKPDLQNVLNTHANKLYATAVDHYNDNADDTITEEDARHIIQNVFVCLTKIDHNRAVRNRITLQEITDITDISHLTPEKVRKLTAIFREPHNTLIQPFIGDDGNDPLGENDLLDISHESLIRNWTLLKTWAKNEYGHVNTFSDLSAQVHRWIEHGRSSDYLLPIGPLSHFEDWFNTIKPNKFWINRYNLDIDDKAKRMADSENMLVDTKQFINASTQKHLITRTVMRLGAKRIAAVMAVLGFIVFSSFYMYEEYAKSSDVVFDKILHEGIDLLGDENTGIDNKVWYCVEMIRANPDNFDLIFSSLDPDLSLDLSLSIATDLINRCQHEKHYLLDKSLNYADSLLSNIDMVNGDESNINQNLKKYTDFLYTLDIYKYFQPSAHWEEMAGRQANNLAILVTSLLEDPDAFKPGALHLNNALELVLNHEVWNKEELEYVLQHLSPLEEKYIGSYSDLYDASNSVQVGATTSFFSHNGLYQELAYLYARTGNLNKTLQCIDTLLLYNQAYFGNDYNLLIDNATTISAYFLVSGNLQLFEEFVTRYSLQKGMSRLDFLDQLAGRTIFSARTNEKMVVANSQFLHNLNLGLMDDATRSQVFQSYEKEISLLQNTDERNFRLALMTKHKALFTAQKSILSTGQYNMNELAPVYEKSWEYFSKVSQQYLNESDTRMHWSAAPMQSQRKIQYIFPGYMEYQTIWVPRYYGFHYFNTSFIEFLTIQDHVNSLFEEQDELNIISEWTSYLIARHGAFAISSFEAFLDFEIISSFLKALKGNPNYSPRNFTSLKVLTALQLFEEGKDEIAMDVVEEIAMENLPGSLADIINGITSVKFGNVGKLCHQLKIRGENEYFEKIIDAFKLPVNKSVLLAYIAHSLGKAGYIEECRELIDRAKSEDKLRVTDNNLSVARIALALTTLPDLEGYPEAREKWKNLNAKNYIDNLFAESLSITGNAWRAYEDIEKLTPVNARFVRYRQMGRGIRDLKALEESDDWELYDKTNPWWWNFVAYNAN